MREETRAATPSEVYPAALTEKAALHDDLLAAAEQRTRELLEQVPAIFYEEVPAVIGETHYISPQVEEILGVTPEEYIREGDWWQRHLHPDDRERVLAEYEAGLADPLAAPSSDSEYRIVRPDGRVVWLNDRETVVRDEQGTPVMVRGAMFDITAQKEAEARVQESEARYRALVEQLPLITYIWEVDPAPGDDTAYYTSPQLESILGYTVDDYDDDPEGWRQMIHPDDRERIFAAAERTETTGEPFVEEYRFLHKEDGRSVWMHDESVLLRRNAEGRPWLFQGIMYDVTDRIEAEARLKAAEEQYRTLVERMPAVTYVWDACATAEDNRNYTSPQIVDLLGYTAEEWESDPDRWQSDLHPDDRDRVLAATSRAAETGRPWVQEFRYVHRDGHAVWVHDEAALSRRDEDGRPRLFEGVMFDITDRVEADLALQESLARFRALANGAPVGIFETDPEGNCTYVNDRWCQAAGMDASAAMGVGWTAALHPDDHDRVIAEWVAAVDAGVEFRSEYRFLQPEGEVRWVVGRAVTVADVRGEATGFIGTIDDVTEQRATEEQLRLIRSAVEHTGHAVIIAELGPDDASPAVYVNPAFGAMTGFEVEELIGAPTTGFYQQDERTAEIRDRLRLGSSESVEIDLIRRDGSRFEAEGVVSPIRDASGAFSHVVAILRDMTEIREVERSLRESLEELRRTDADRRVSLAQIVEAQEQELDRMAEGIEDRSLQELTAVRMRMDTLRRNLSDPTQLGALDKLEGSVEQAVGQLRGLLSELRPRELTTEGLAGAIREYLSRTAGGITAEVVGALDVDPEPSQVATAFRIVQESLTSAIDVRGARAARVELEDARDGFAVRIVDDGMPWAAAGSTTMADRAGLAGGSCRLFAGPDGPTVELWLPLRAPILGGTPLRRS
jgi:PAS domain S-box-containing protein